MMTGSCHCGAVQVKLLHKPDYVNFCDCSFCAKMGGAWAYFAGHQVEIREGTGGATKAYRRADYDSPAVEMRFCGTCGTATHWVLTENIEGDRMGVNIRIFDPKDVEGIEARFLDGRNWFGDTIPNLRKPNETLCPQNFN